MKNSLGKSAVQRITKILAIADPLLDVKLFEREARRSLDKMELKQRVEHIIDALHISYSTCMKNKHQQTYVQHSESYSCV